MSIRKWFSFVIIMICVGCSVMNHDLKVFDKNNPDIRVLVMDSSPEVVFITQTAWVVTDYDADESMNLPENTEVLLFVEDEKVVAISTEGTLKAHGLIFDSKQKNGTVQIRKSGGKQGHTYEGRIEVHKGADGMPEIIISLPMEEYLKGVIPYEIGPASPLAAQCAQAVAARSEAYVALVTRKYAGERYDICSSVQCQVFRGNERRSERSDHAVELTRGHILMFDGEPISAYYASTCGGHMEDIRNVWPHRAGEKAYWGAAGFDGDDNLNLDLSNEDDFRKWLHMSPGVWCNPEFSDIPNWTHKNFRWTRDVDAADLTEWIAEHKDIGRVIALKPLKRGVSGRLIELEFVGQKGSVVISPELKIRRVFKPGLRSAAFVVDISGSKDRPDQFIIQGAGSGHGVGMCQVGAIGMANAGKSFKEILEHYYPKAEIEKLY